MKWNPLPLFSPFVLLFFSIPLTTFAVLTTGVAFGTLLIRVSIVYFELGLALVHSWLFAQSAAAKKEVETSKPVSIPPSPARSSPTRRRSSRRRSNSIVSTASSQDLSLTSSTGHNRPTKSDSFASLVGTGEPNRDFEGVGGWRLSGEEAEEAVWIGMNSRLQLPAAVPDRHPRHHHRSLTGGASSSQRWACSPEAIRMSPVQSRARTPNTSNETLPALEGYFALQPHGRTVLTAIEGQKVMGDARRKSFGGSSTSSASSARTPKKATRQVGH